MYDISNLDKKTINGFNLYAYCNNNPIMYADPSGHMPEWLKNVLDIGLYYISAAMSIAVGLASKNPLLGITTFGSINNAINKFYYNNISDGQSDLNSGSYREKYLNRWDRLDYAKFQTKDENYNLNSWRYFSEYNFHMYAWMVTKNYYTGKKGDGFLSDIAYSAFEADVDLKNFETGQNAWRNIFYIGLGLLGI